MLIQIDAELTATADETKMTSDGHQLYYAVDQPT